MGDDAGEQPTAVVVVGLGQMGAVFSHALLRAGHPVFPVTRERPAEVVRTACPEPELVLVAVGENDLDGVLAELPSAWKDRVGLLQNELTPRDWERHDIADPTVAVVWFEKKKNIATRVILPSPIAGPAAPLLNRALDTIDVASRHVARADLVFELTAKNLYILTANIAGMQVGGTVGELWANHRALAEEVAQEILAVQEKLVGRELPRDRLVGAMVAAFDADPDHRCRGRSSPQRLARALRHAKELGVDTPRLAAIGTAFREG